MFATPLARIARPASRLAVSLGLGLLALGLSAGGSLAQDVNENGILVLHTDNDYVYTRGVSPSGASGVACAPNFDCPYSKDCAENIADLNPTSTRGSDVAVWWVMALFPENTCPQVKGLTFGIEWDASEDLNLVGWGPSGDFELPTDDWPANGSGNAVTFADPQRSQLIEVYWFAGYAEDGPAEFRLKTHPVHEGAFADHLCPPTINRVEDYGSLGLNGAQGTLGRAPDRPTTDSFYRATPTGIRSPVLITWVEEGLLAIGDELGVFADDRLVGSAKWTGAVPFEIQVWEWNTEHGYPGVRAGDRLTVETWCPATLVTQPVLASTQRGGSPVFLDNDHITTMVLGNRPPTGQGTLGTTPAEFTLLKAFPNPSTGPMQIRFQLPRGTDVETQVFDAAGRLVRTMETNLASGERSVYWDSRDSDARLVPSGMYYARVRAEGEARVLPIQILR